MIKMVKIGEIETEIIDEVGMADVMNVHLRIGWGAETTSRIAFKPAEDLNTGDVIRVTIEKIYEEPDPEPEPGQEIDKEAVTSEAVEASGTDVGEEFSAVKVDETSLEADGGEEDTADKVEE